MTVTTASHRALSWWFLPNTLRGHQLSAHQLCPDPQFVSHPAQQAACCVGSVSVINIIHWAPASFSHPGSSVPKSCTSCSLCVSTDVFITSWVCAAHGLEPQTMLQGIILAPQHESVKSCQLQLEYECDACNLCNFVIIAVSAVWICNDSRRHFVYVITY